MNQAHESAFPTFLSRHIQGNDIFLPLALGLSPTLDRLDRVLVRHNTTDIGGGGG